ncbi:MAG TPA: hypothetical protein VN688_09390 [Gemmataceae bacterium]|nr:hypothetical protein [Gemmataceae bacterium]
MDCKTARLLLDFARPQARELVPEEAGALESHLDQCLDCHGLAQGERQLDERLGKAMRQIEVPAGLRDQLLARLEADRGDWYRRRFAHGMRAVAAVAAVLLLGWGAWRWLIESMPAPIDLQTVAAAANHNAAEDPRTKIEESLKAMGVETPLSPHLNYNLLAWPPAKAELPGYPGQKVPMLVFERGGRRARVYLVATKQIPADGPPTVGGATYKLEVLPSEGEPYTFLVVHDGDNLDWLRPPEPPAT